MRSHIYQSWLSDQGPWNTADDELLMEFHRLLQAANKLAQAADSAESDLLEERQKRADFVATFGRKEQ